MLYKPNGACGCCVRCEPVGGLLSLLFFCIALICDFVELVAWLNYTVKLCQPGYSFMHLSFGCSQLLAPAVMCLHTRCWLL